jgi:hypothetical protein
MKARKLHWSVLIVSLFLQLVSMQVNAQDSYPEDGWWWDTTAPGRGYFIERQKDHLFIAVFIYTDDGAPEWLSSDGKYMPAADDPDSIGSYTGNVYRSSNGQCIGCDYVSPTVNESEQSPLNITFSDNQNGILEWFGESINITRFFWSWADAVGQLTGTWLLTELENNEPLSQLVTIEISGAPGSASISDVLSGTQIGSVELLDGDLVLTLADASESALPLVIPESKRFYAGFGVSDALQVIAVRLDDLPLGEFTIVNPGRFLAAELLGRPTANSVTVNVIPAVNLEGYFEYGPAPGNYTRQTEPQTVNAGTLLEDALTGLEPNSRYYYRLRHRAAGDDGPFLEADEHGFITQRPPGETFTFVVQADPHLDDKSDEEVYRQTLLNEAADQPDFLIDLGDDSMVDKCVMNGPTWCKLPHGSAQDYAQVEARNLLNRQFYADIAHSIPVFLALGNHEAESGWRFNGSGDSLPYWDVTARKKYYPNPVPDGFYSGSDTPDPHVGLRENYYAWEWGDALFMVLDPFGYSENGGGWGWSLGKEQYDWMADTLGSSNAAFKFVFIHHMVGGGLLGEPGNKSARGGVLFADYFEWGGYDPNASGDGPGDYVFDTQRPGWGRPIRDVFVETGVTIFFHGHDHLYAMEEIDGMVYQEVPQPSHPTTDTAAKSAEEYGYGDAVTYATSGHLRVTVSPQEVTVEYVRSFQPEDQDASHVNGTVMHSYTRQP